MSKLIDGVFYSSLIRKDMPYRVLVPDVVSLAGGSLPVLYLLHGLFGSCENWTDLTGIQSYVDDANLMIVMPEGGDNWYTDSEEKYESYLIKELIPEIEGRFNAAADRGKRAIAGNSMGGYGALKIAFKHPEMFAFAASCSGAFHAAELPEDLTGCELTPSISRVFGKAQSRIRVDNNLFDIARRASLKANELPGIYFDCGLEDKFISVNRKFAVTLSQAGIEYQYLEINGGHDWSYWDRRIRYLVSSLKQKFFNSNSDNWSDQL